MIPGKPHFKGEDGEGPHGLGATEPSRKSLEQLVAFLATSEECATSKQTEEPHRCVGHHRCDHDQESSKPGNTLPYGVTAEASTRAS